MNVIDSADLLFPDRSPPLGWPSGLNHEAHHPNPDPGRYVVWVLPRPGSEEQAPRLALHLVECRNGAHP
jgi:hypothetical protein